jgi:cysteine desulfurase / selenocysteine lyase
MAQQQVDPPRIYFDNAATSWPKPEAVYRAVDHYQRELGAPAGRSGYAEAVAVSQAVEDARRRVATLLGLDDFTHLIFTANGTDSLNLALHGLLRDGDHVVTTVVEHNSVLRPLDQWQRAGSVAVTHVGCNSAGYVDPDQVRAAIRPATRLIAVSHASNVTGAVQPIKEISRIAHAAGILILCDAAQTVGHLPLDVRELEVDLLAASGHKGLLGPLGTGILSIGSRAVAELRSVRQGGTGTRSEETTQPEVLPSKFESGNLNVPGILGLGAAVEFLQSQGIDQLARQTDDLTERLLAGLEAIPTIRVLGPSASQPRVPLVSLVVEGYDPQEVALSLDAAYRIQVRPGLHCAPLMHRALGTDANGGTVRLSLGIFNTVDQIELAVSALAEIATSHAVA